MLKKKSKKLLLFNNLIQDYWLEKIYKKKCFIATKQNQIKDFKKYTNSFIFLKTKNKISEHYLKDKKLRFLGINRTFQKKINYNYNYLKKKNIYYKINLNNDEKTKTINIAFKNFKLSRFHLDKRLPASKSNLIKKKTLENYFSGNRGDKIIIQFYKRKISGFCLLIFENKNTARIDLICIDKKYSKRGLAKDLLKYTLYKMKKIKKKILLVSTQDKNVPAVKLYDSLKFARKSILYLYHYIS